MSDSENDSKVSKLSKGSAKSSRSQLMFEAIQKMNEESKQAIQRMNEEAQKRNEEAFKRNEDSNQLILQAMHKMEAKN